MPISEFLTDRALLEEARFLSMRQQETTQGPIRLLITPRSEPEAAITLRRHPHLKQSYAMPRSSLLYTLMAWSMNARLMERRKRRAPWFFHSTAPIQSEMNQPVSRAKLKKLKNGKKPRSKRK